jgi:hypothetical protein
MERQSPNQSVDRNDQDQIKEESFKNIETSVNNRSYFDDDYAVTEEDNISSDEAKSENDDNGGKR